MPGIEINDLDNIGVVSDTPAYLLPAEAVTTALNMRVVEGGLERLLGWSQVFGTPGVAPHFAMPVRTSSAVFWVYASLTKIYGYDGSSHTNVTRQSGGVDVDYTASVTREWNGTALSSIPILNNGVDIPQFWATASLGTKMANLTNWPSGLRAKVVRAFGPFLIAINTTSGGTNYPHRVKWSHPADPGTVPSSWDETDPTVDAGEFELPDVDAGVLVDALPLSETFYLYKEASIWKMRYVGGREIFSTGQAAWLTTTGILAPRCVCVTGDGTRHVWASQDDILWHDGNRVRSLLTSRRRREIFNSIDTSNYLNCFMFANPLRNEVWFCYPSAGNTNPNKAVIFNYQKGGDQWPSTDADGITFRNAAVGPIQGAADELWSAGSDTWDQDTGPWEQLARRRVILCGTGDTKFFNLDDGSTRNGTTFSGTVQRLGLPFLGRKANGDLIVDLDRNKLIVGVWPKISGNSVSIRVGVQNYIDGAVTWGSAVTFDPTDEVFANPGPLSGLMHAYEVVGTSSFKLTGLKYDVRPLGQFNNVPA